MFRKNMSLEQKKKRAKISWIVLVAIAIPLKIIQIVSIMKFDIDPFLSFLETGNPFLCILVSLLTLAISWYMFYTLLSIMIDTAWRKLGIFLLATLTLSYIGVSIAICVHYFTNRSF